MNTDTTRQNVLPGTIADGYDPVDREHPRRDSRT